MQDSRSTSQSRTEHLHCRHQSFHGEALISFFLKSQTLQQELQDVFSINQTKIHTETPHQLSNPSSLKRNARKDDQMQCKDLKIQKVSNPSCRLLQNLVILGRWTHWMLRLPALLCWAPRRPGQFCISELRGGTGPDNKTELKHTPYYCRRPYLSLRTPC